MSNADTLFDFFTTDVKDHPWNLFPNFPENLSPELIQKISLNWDSVGSICQSNFLIGCLVPHKRKISPVYKQNVLLLVNFALQSPASSKDLKMLAKAIKFWIENGYLDLSEYSDSFKEISTEISKVLSELNWIPLESCFLSKNVVENYNLSSGEKEGLWVKQEFEIPSFSDRLIKYGVESVSENTLKSPGDRGKKRDSSFLRRTSRGSITSPVYPKVKSGSSKVNHYLFPTEGRKK